MALLTYRSTPLAWCNLSPAKLLMGRHLRTTLSQVADQLLPQWKYLESKTRSLNKTRSQHMTTDTEPMCFHQFLMMPRFGSHLEKQPYPGRLLLMRALRDRT